MGDTRLRVCMLLAALGSACSDPAPVLAAADGVLALELGSPERGSLRQALERQGVSVGAPHWLGASVPAPDAPALSVPGPGDPEALSSDAPKETPKPPPVQEPVPESEDLIVTLANHETIAHLARKYLGNGNRFREILQANGWDEEDVKLLRAGKQVRIPRASLQSPRR